MDLANICHIPVHIYIRHTSIHIAPAQVQIVCIRATITRESALPLLVTSDMTSWGDLTGVKWNLVQSMILCNDSRRTKVTISRTQVHNSSMNKCTFYVVFHSESLKEFELTANSLGAHIETHGKLILRSFSCLTVNS